MSLNKHNLGKIPRESKVQKSWWRFFGGRGRSTRSESGSSQDSRTAGWIGSHGSRSSYEPSSVSSSSYTRQPSESYFNHRPTRDEYYPRPSIAAPPLPLGPPSPRSGIAPPQRPTRPPTKASPPLASHNSASSLNTLKMSTIALQKITFIGNLKQRPEDTRDCLGLIDGSSIIPASRLGPEATAHLQNILRSATSSGRARDIVFRYEGNSRGMQLTDPCGGKVTVVLNFSIRWYAAPRVILSIRAVDLKEVGTTRVPQQPFRGPPSAFAPGKASAANTRLNVGKRPAALVDPLTPQIRAWRVTGAVKLNTTSIGTWQGTLTKLQVCRGTPRTNETLQEALKGYTVYWKNSQETVQLSQQRAELFVECSLTWDDREKKVFAEKIRAIRT